MPKFREIFKGEPPEKKAAVKTQVENALNVKRILDDMGSPYDRSEESILGALKRTNEMAGSKRGD